MSLTIDRFDGEYRFLSNFYIVHLTYEGLEYWSSEAAYQSAKSNSMSVKQAMSAFRSPANAKRYGRMIDLREDWEDIKLQVMEDILRIKFSIPLLARQLKDTGDRVLIEGNGWGDQFWGVSNGRGLNHLGRLLMEIRKDL